MATVKSKFVNVTCRQPIRLRNKIVRAIYRETLTVEEIADCIAQRAMVEEILPFGGTMALDYSNYNQAITPEFFNKTTDNEPTVTVNEPTTVEKVDDEVKPVDEVVVEDFKQEEPVVAPVKEEEIIEDAEAKVKEAKKAFKGKK